MPSDFDTFDVMILGSRGPRRKVAVLMPALVFARPPVDGDELARVQKLAAARHAPADWMLRARMVTLSWSGLTVSQIAG